MSNYFMESKEQDSLWIVFENCESICVAPEKIISFSIQGIKVNRSWPVMDGEDMEETTTAEGFYLSLTNLTEERQKRLIKHQDITALHFKGQEYLIEWKGDYDNLYQNTCKAHDTLHINVDKDNYTPWED